MILNIFLDTNIYEENNFFHSNNIQGLFYYSRIGVIKLFMTSISKNELISRLEKRLEEVKDDHNKLVNALNKPKFRILKNLLQYEDVSKSQILVSKSLIELSRKLDTIIESSRITILSNNNVNVEDIFNQYYLKEPPFSNKNEKKYEFPDAFIIKSVDEWCKTNRKKMIVLTKDNDFNGYKSRRLKFERDLPELLNQITIYYDSKQKTQIIPRINKALEDNRNSVLSLIELELDKFILLDLDFEKIIGFKRLPPTYKEHKITAIRPEYAEVTYFLEVNYSFTVIPNSLDLEKAIFEESVRPKKIVGEIIIPCDLEINLKNPNRIKLKWINQNDKLRITI